MRERRASSRAMRSRAWLLALLLAAEGAAGARRRVRPPPGPKEPKPTIGDSLDLQYDNEYLGKNWQAVCQLTPGSSNRRILTRDGQMYGMRRRRGVITWLKKKDDFLPWENPWADPARAPFKVRIMKLDPRGVALSMAQEKRLELGAGQYQGRDIMSVKLAKPRAWWKFWPAPAVAE